MYPFPFRPYKPAQPPPPEAEAGYVFKTQSEDYYSRVLHTLVPPLLPADHMDTIYLRDRFS